MTPTKLTSIRMTQAAFDMSKGQNLSRMIRVGLHVLEMRYPNIARTEIDRLQRKGNYYDVLTCGARRYTKVRIPVLQLDWLRFNQLNISAACEWAILDSRRYLPG